VFFGSEVEVMKDVRRGRGVGEGETGEIRKAPYVPPRLTVTEVSIENVLLAICMGGGAPGPIGNCAASCSSTGS